MADGVTNADVGEKSSGVSDRKSGAEKLPDSQKLEGSPPASAEEAYEEMGAERTLRDLRNEEVADKMLAANQISKKEANKIRKGKILNPTEE